MNDISPLRYTAELTTDRLNGLGHTGTIVGTRTGNQVGQNSFGKIDFLVGPGGAPKPGGNFLFRWGTNF